MHVVFKTLPFPHHSHPHGRGGIHLGEDNLPCLPLAPGRCRLYRTNAQVSTGSGILLRSLKMVSFYLMALCAIQWLLLAPLTESRNVVVRKKGR